MARAYDDLGRRGQIARLRGVARAALAQYDLGAMRVRLLAHLFNTTFRVDTAGGRYVLRIHRSGMPTVASVEAGLAWQAALRRDTTLDVPDPMPTRDGARLTVISTPGVPRPIICVLLRWLPGRLLEAGLTPAHLERVGNLTARLHDHAMQFGPPPGFARSRVDWPLEAARGLPDPFAPEVIAEAEEIVAASLGADAAALVGRALRQVAAAEAALGQGPAVFGLIHADLHQYNLLFEGDTVRAIDFDDCGFGPRLYDPGVTLNMLHDRADYPALRAGWLAGYRQVRPLPPEQEAWLDTFIALRQVQDLLWVLIERQHPAIQGDWTAMARRQLAHVARLLGDPL